MKKINGADARERSAGISDSQNSHTVIFDSGKVQLGAVSPAFPPRANVRVGALSPAFPAPRTSPVNMSDTTKVRIGAVSPAFPPRDNK